MIKKVYKVETIDQVHQISGLPKPKNPLVTIIDYSKVNVSDAPESGSFVCDFYSVTYKKHCSFLYGRQKFDHQEGTMHCTSPGQVITYDRRNEEENTEGMGLFFHPELIRRTNLAKKMHEYTFFSYDESEALHISDDEKNTLVNIFSLIQTEINANIDRYSNELIVSNIELILNYCRRFYNRQFITRSNQNKDIITSFENFISNYFNSDNLKNKGIPSVKTCAEAMNLSPNYFSDLLKSETGKNTSEHIQFRLLEKAKILLANPELSISEIAYELGFEYSQSFSKFFKKKIGISPTIYRAS